MFNRVTLNMDIVKCYQHRCMHWSFLLVFIAAFLAVPAPMARAAMTLYVAPSGNNANNCLSPNLACKTVGAAIVKAANGDTVSIAAGIYGESLVINKNLKLIGSGLDTTFLDGGRTNRVVKVLKNVTANISNLTIQNGFVAGRVDEDGGGI